MICQENIRKYFKLKNISLFFEKQGNRKEKAPYCYFWMEKQQNVHNLTISSKLAEFKTQFPFTPNHHEKLDKQSKP